MKNKHGVDVGAQAIENEEDVAQKRESSKCHDRRHAKTSKDAERCREAEEVDPGHSFTPAFGLGVDVVWWPLRRSTSWPAPRAYERARSIDDHWKSTKRHGY